MESDSALKIALVTGGSRGIGRAICLALARRRFGVAINYWSSPTEADAVRRECLAQGAPWAECCQGGVHRHEDRLALADWVAQAPGVVHVLVNNAGISSVVRGDMLEVTTENWDRVLDTNLKGPFFLTQQIARLMLAGRTEGAGTLISGKAPAGVVINVSSISATVASPDRSEYCISKAGLSMMTQLLAHRLAENGILVYEVRPGVIRTDMTAGAVDKYDRLIADGLTPIRRWGEPEDVGEAVGLLATGSLPFSTGEVINVDGGFHSRRL